MEKYNNLASSTLSVAATNVDTTLTLTDGSSFPTDSFSVLIGTELIRVTSRSGNVLTVTRGDESTTAAAHPSSALTTHVISARVLNAIRGEVNSYGSTLPTSARAGNKHTFPDGGYGVYDGTVWQFFYMGFKVVRPLITDFGFFNNPGFVSVTQTGLGIDFVATASTDSDKMLFGKTGTPSQVTIGIQHNYNFRSNSSMQLIFSNNANKFLYWQWYGGSGPNMGLSQGVYTNPTSFLGESAYNSVSLPIMFLRLKVVAGNLTTQSSNDGVNFFSNITEAENTYLTRTRVAMGFTNSGTSYLNSAKIFHYEEIP